MKLQHKLLKNLFLFSFLLLSFFSFNQAQTAQAQPSLDVVLSKFPLLDEDIMNDTAIRNLITTTPDLREDLNVYLKGKILLTDSHVFPIGRIENKKVTIVIYGVARVAYKEEKRMIDIHTVAFDRKGEIAGSKKHYLTTSGEIKDKKESYEARITYNGDEVAFNYRIYDQENLEVKKNKTGVYEVTKKGLVFDRYE